MPESKDTDWDWQEFLNRNNNELVATWGNLANRMLSFAYKHWDGIVPAPGDLRPEDEEILAVVEGRLPDDWRAHRCRSPAGRPVRSHPPGYGGQQIPG